MIDRTNVGISPLMSTPITTSFVSSTPIQTTQVIPQTATFTQEYPASIYGVASQGIAIPQTQDALTSFAPQITTPDQAITSFAPEATNVVTTQQTIGAPQTSMTTSVVPNVVLNQQPQAPAQPIAPIMDEDFQRGRPIYDEFNEDRYRNFKFGN